MQRKAVYFGVILLVAIGAFAWLRHEPTTRSHGVGDSNRITAAATIESNALPKPGVANPDTARPNGVQPSAAAATIRSTQVSRTQPQEHAASAAAASSAEPKLSPPRTSQTSATAVPDSQPVRKSAEEVLSVFVTDDPTQVFLPESVRNHAAVQSENVDPDWGPQASQALRDYLVAQFGDRFDIPVADCRQDLCELEAASRLSTNTSQDMHDFEDAIQRMKQQPWWTTLQFDQETGIAGRSPDGRGLFIYFFSRK
jgi:hypothetical protein